MPPVAAIVTGFFLVAVPVIILMTIWSVVTMWRVIFPEEDLPMDRGPDVTQAEARGESVPVALSDIVEQQRRRPTGPIMPRREHVGPDAEAGPLSPLAEDLWRRRN